MKNIQVIDGAINSVYDIFAVTDEQFALIFPQGQDIAFIEEVQARLNEDERHFAFDGLWDRRQVKAQVQGIHGLLFYELEAKKVYYPNRRDEDAINPDGSRLR